MAKQRYPYQPDSVTAPGATLKETLDEHGMSQKELSDRMNRPVKTISEIINGKTQITSETAIQLENVLGIPASFWLNREKRYREFLAKQQEESRLKKQTEELKNFPMRDLRKRGYVSRTRNKVQLVKETIQFYGVNHLKNIPTIYSQESFQFRKSNAHTIHETHLAAWIREGEIKAALIDCQPYSEKKFKKVLQEIRKLTTEPPEVFTEKMARLCAEAGVAVVLIPQYEKCRTSGLARWVHPKKALIQLSLRYKTDDHFWFSFFHEAAHLLLHSKKKTFLDGNGGKMETDEIEEEANRFAAEFLIPDHTYQEIISEQPLSKEKVRQYASQLQIAPGIIVGRLQHDGIIRYNWMNDLKRKFEWKMD